MTKEKEEVQELEIPVELLEKDPIELAENDNDINEIRYNNFAYAYATLDYRG